MLRLPKVSRQAVHGAESETAFAKVGLFEHDMYILSKGQVMHLVISWQQGWGGVGEILSCSGVSCFSVDL